MKPRFIQPIFDALNQAGLTMVCQQLPFLILLELIEPAERCDFRHFRRRRVSRTDGTKCRQGTRWRVGELLIR
jgi:hypothetical protein